MHAPKCTSDNINNATITFLGSNAVDVHLELG